MPGIDFAALRDRVSILDVLQLLDFQPVYQRGPRLRGPCLFKCSSHPRVFVVNVATHQYYCHACHRHGNPLDLWAQDRDLPIFEAAQDLCHQLHIDPPRIDRW